MKMTSLLNAALAVALIGASVAPVARAQAPLENTPIPMWVPAGAVSDVVRVGNTLVVGGRFEYVGPLTGPFAIVDAANPAAFDTSARLSGNVYRVIADGSGGWFVTIDTEPTGGGWTLVHITASGTLDPQFVPVTGFFGITAIALEAGRLFVAGRTSASNQNQIIALDPATGALQSWTPVVLPSAVNSLVAGGGVIYANVSRTNGLLGAVAFDAATGAAVPFPVLQDAEVAAVDGNRVYVRASGGGTISAYIAAGQPVPGFASVTCATIFRVVASSSHVYVAGTACGAAAPSAPLVAFRADTGGLAWAAPPFSAVDVNFIPGTASDLALDGNTLFVGGRFASIGGVARTHVAAFDAATGTLSPWAPSVGGVGVSAMAAGAGKVAIAGGIGSVGGITKRGLVSLDLATGRPSAVQPPDSNNVTALAASGDLVVAATTQYPVNMIPEVFAYSAATGTRYPIALQVNGSVSSLAVSGGTLFMGGLFNTIAGQSRRNLAAYDLLSGTMRAWNPSPDDFVRRIKVHDGALYAVGQFTSLTGYGRNGAAAFDVNGLEVTSWDPRVEGLAVNDLDASQDRIFLGIFVRRTPLGAPVVRTVAVDSRSGAPLNVDLPLGTDLAQVGGTLAVLIGASSVYGALDVGTFDGLTGQPLPWQPTLYTSAFSDNGERLIGVEGHLVVVGTGVPRTASYGGLAVFKPRVVLPGAPRQIQMTVVGSTVSLAWSPGAAPAPLGYVLEAGSAPGLSDLGRFSLGGATQVAAAVAPGTYALRVRAVGASGEGPASSEWLFTTPATSTPPSAPSALVGSVAGNVVTLGWNAAAGNATTYVLEAGTAPGLSNLGVLPLGSLDTGIAGAVPAGTYYFRVRAANAFGTSAASNEIVLVVP